MQQGICHIVGALPLDGGPTPVVEAGDLLVAADRGYQTLRELCLEPHLVVGDFDSLGAVPDGRNVRRIPRIKDETDTGFAWNAGYEEGYRRFLIYGCLGGRTDHTLANLQLLAGMTRRGASGILAGPDQCVAAVTNGFIPFPERMAGRVSVFCHSGIAYGVDLDGLHYPLDNHTLADDFPLGVSNEFLGLEARVSVRRGTLLVLWEHGLTPGGLRTLVNQIKTGVYIV